MTFSIHYFIFQQGKSPCLAIFDDNNLIGKYEFFTGLASKFTARCISECEIYILRRDTFLKILE